MLQTPYVLLVYHVYHGEHLERLPRMEMPHVDQIHAACFKHDKCVKLKKVRILDASSTTLPSSPRVEHLECLPLLEMPHVDQVHVARFNHDKVQKTIPAKGIENK